jgi:hypothetical protein
LRAEPISTTLTLLPALARASTIPIHEHQLLHLQSPFKTTGKPLTLHFRVKTLNIRQRIRIRARNNLRNNNCSFRPLRHNNIDQLPQPGVCVFPAVSSTIVSTSVQKDDIGLDASISNGVGRARNLVDDPARVALVVVVGHGAAFHGADVVDFGARRGEGG